MREGALELERVLSATFGALLTTITVTPLDVVKVRLQGQLRDDPARFRGTVETLLRIFRREGLLSLYRGFLPSMAMSLPGTVIYFTGYEKMHELIAAWGDGAIPAAVVPLLAGSSARVFAAAAVSPLELIRTRMQFAGQEHGRLRVVVRELAAAMRAEGTRPLWRGLQPTLWRDVPFSAVYWLLLETLTARVQKMLSPRVALDEPLPRSAVSFGCGAVAGAIAAAITTPFDVAKTQQQVLFNRVFDPSCPQGGDRPVSPSTLGQLRDIWRHEGWRGLTRGIVPRVGKIAPACAIMIGSYEFGKSFLSRHIT